MISSICKTVPDHALAALEQWRLEGFCGALRVKTARVGAVTALGGSTPLVSLIAEARTVKQVWLLEVVSGKRKL